MSPQPIFADGIYRSSDSGLPIRRWCRERLQQWSVPHSLMSFKTSLGRCMVVCAGTGMALPPVVIVSGSGLNAATSLPLACALKARRRLFLVDLPGQPGLSSAHGPPHGHFSAYGAWLSELLPRLTTDPVVIVGHSIGAAAALACSPSPQVAGLVLVNPLGFVSMHLSSMFRALRLRWSIFPSMEHSEQLLSQLLSPGFVPDTPLMSWYCLLGEHCVGLRYDHPLPPTTIHRWATAETPVAVAAGSHDRFLSADRLRGPVRSLLGVQVQTIHNCGHLAVREAPSAVAAIVEAITSTSR
ncbi:MAG: alpha/beta hydrolase [Rhodococcus sp. (in: high G+C Gram-positive bacteria)]|uniref:alpha/beta fold hydrolase n=1 Tax=Rhodococcus sp. TaxID=1831 RepID=UPI002AD82670|nr:alpha/beta hydrolase [Rhodococcus sp. (in: high G+C Gram-positive bacteria)]